ncbi:MAG: sugar transferase [Candidatus Omnitrophota bacterium]
MSNFSAKRTFDALLAFFGLLMASPVWCVIMALVYCEDRGPIYYLQERLGKDGKIFKVIKFRSMVVQAERGTGPIQAREHDARVTSVGRLLRETAMDELPQLVNILKGEMSFVGPRALRPFEIEYRTGGSTDLEHNAQVAARQSVSPGLTGVAQVFAPCDAVIAEKLRYDLWYIRHRTFSLDIKLILLSFFITFRGKWEDRGKKLWFLRIPVV